MKMTHRGTRTGTKPTVLIAEDESSTRLFLQDQLDKAGFHALPAKDGHEALSLLSDSVRVALVDLTMPDLGGLECIRRMRHSHPDVEPIVVTASSAVSDAVEAMKCGAFDYITKPVDVDELVEAVRRASRTAELAEENRQLKEAIGLPYAETPFIGTSAAARRVIKMAERIATLDGTVLITGESGVGKGLVARMIHNAGARGARPFVTVSCTALPRELVEAELFGHEKGAFTGAYERRPGRLEIADGGSLFLDEVGDMPLDLQPKLLSFLQERAFQRIGSNTTITVRVRIIAATHQDLRALCAERRFREDLFFRLNVLPIEIPPLRRRRDDILAIAEHLLGRIGSRTAKGDPFTLADDAQQALLAYEWPGNVRELENVIQRTTAFSGGSTITAADLPSEITGAPGSPHHAHESLAGMPLRDVERLAILQTLDACRGNRAEAARRLGISKKGIYLKMKRLGLSAECV